MSALVVTDLDRTLVFSRRRLGGIAPAALACVERRDGVPCGWMTPRSSALLAELAAAALWVPVTTRTTAEFSRLALPGPPRVVVCAHGGVLLVDGRPDEAWGARVARVAARAAPVGEVARLVSGLVGTPRVCEGLFLVVDVDPARVPPGSSDDLAAALRPCGWWTRRVDRKLYAFPAGLDKASALGALRARFGGDPVLAAGDSVLDAGMLGAADAAVVPAHGEPGELPSSVAATRSSGVAAGEEIAAWLLARAAGVGTGPAAPAV